MLDRHVNPRDRRLFLIGLPAIIVFRAATSERVAQQCDHFHRTSDMRSDRGKVDVAARYEIAVSSPAANKPASFYEIGCLVFAAQAASLRAAKPQSLKA